MADVRFLAVTRQEAELLMDSFRVANPLTHDLALKAASLVLEFAAEDGGAFYAGEVTTSSATAGDGDCRLVG